MKLFQAIGSIFKGIGNAIWSAYHWLIGRHCHYHLEGGSCATKDEWWKEQKLVNAKLMNKAYLHLANSDNEYNNYDKNLYRKKVDEQTSLVLGDELNKVGFFNKHLQGIIEGYLIESDIDIKPKKGNKL